MWRCLDRRRWNICILFIAAYSLGAVGAAWSQTVTAHDHDVELREALGVIAATDPTQSDAARSALAALDQPATEAGTRLTRNRRISGSRRIVNGLPARGHAAVGALLKGGDPRTAKAWCTGTLVGCDKFLTAAHCIAEEPSPSGYVVFFQELGFFQVARIDWPKDKYQFPYFDLAMLTLSRRIQGIAPISVNYTAAPLDKSLATIVGYGRTGGTRHDYGIKREGTVLTNACPKELDGKNLLCWKFDAKFTALYSRSNTCNADSGGGIFIVDLEKGRKVNKLFGVVSGGIDSNCVKHDLSYNVDVHKFGDWLKQVGEDRLSSQVCGEPLWTSKSNEPIIKVVTVSAKTPEVAITFAVHSGMRLVRVTLNGEDDGSGRNDFDLELISDESKVPHCSEAGLGQFAACEIALPQPGQWHAKVKRKRGTGKAQITIMQSRLEQ